MKTALFCAAAISALACATSAFAADAADATVEELVVTGRAGSEAQKKIEASYAVTVVNEE